MENLCDKCKQENCPPCLEKSQERREWIGNLVIGVLMLWDVARISYLIGEFNEIITMKMKVKSHNLTRL